MVSNSGVVSLWCYHGHRDLEQNIVLFGSSNVTVNVTKNRHEVVIKQSGEEQMMMMLVTSCGSMPKFIIISLLNPFFFFLNF